MGYYGIVEGILESNDTVLSICTDGLTSAGMDGAAMTYPIMYFLGSSTLILQSSFHIQLVNVATYPQALVNLPEFLVQWSDECCT